MLTNAEFWPGSGGSRILVFGAGSLTLAGLALGDAGAAAFSAATICGPGL